ncbi:LOB domain-containing protein 27-like [Dorcoceras hygrometricum]|uniref:LOB domain-containing protein 27-like n=1 Tax=Dorcoceras hygrometricum TaxID=472368 RepID=A0A2Z7BLD0_9LAMI|nr:LOB domain-containing protein 27-like [Dorcoceras hygrometricum]
MTLKGGSTPSCAACKYRRRKCTATCPLAPYFPANKPKMFQNVHRLFGVSNVTKTLESLKTKDERDDAMKSIIYEAEMRDRIPVYGCPYIINQLSLQLHAANEELRKVNLQIATCKEQSNQLVDHGSNQRVEDQLVGHPFCSPSPPQEFGGVDSQDAEGMGSVPCRFFMNADGGIYMESYDDVARSVLGLDFGSDVIRNHSLLSTHVEREPNLFDIQKEPKILVQDYGGLRYSTTDDHDTKSYLETYESRYINVTWFRYIKFFIYWTR